MLKALGRDRHFHPNLRLGLRCDVSKVWMSRDACGDECIEGGADAGCCYNIGPTNFVGVHVLISRGSLVLNM